MHAHIASMQNSTAEHNNIRMQCMHASLVVLLLCTNATSKCSTGSAHDQGEQADWKCRQQTSLKSTETRQRKKEEGRREEEEGRRKEEDGVRMRTLTSKRGSIGPVMVQMAAVSRSKPSEVMLLPKSKVADVTPVCIRRACHADQSLQLTQMMLMRSCVHAF